jgi:hypothetical protein
VSRPEHCRISGHRRPGTSRAVSEGNIGVSIANDGSTRDDFILYPSRSFSHLMGTPLSFACADAALDIIAGLAPAMRFQRGI